VIANAFNNEAFENSSNKHGGHKWNIGRLEIMSAPEPNQRRGCDVLRLKLKY
jgi:hypothetical protein